MRATSSHTGCAVLLYILVKSQGDTNSVDLYPLADYLKDLADEYYDDLHLFDPATKTWTLLSTKVDVDRPSARIGHGFTSAGGLLYVHGGWLVSGQIAGYGAWCAQVMGYGVGSGVERVEIGQRR